MKSRGLDLEVSDSRRSRDVFWNVSVSDLNVSFYKLIFNGRSSPQLELNKPSIHLFS